MDLLVPDAPIQAAAQAAAPRFLRLSAGFVYFYFGFLKFYADLSPAEMLATQTIMRMWPWPVDADTVLLCLASAEVLIGLSLMLNVGLKWVLWIFIAHQIGTFSPLVLLPELTFKIAPFSPTMEGQYILKNLVPMAAALTVMLPAVWRRKPRREQDAAPARRERTPVSRPAPVPALQPVALRAQR